MSAVSVFAPISIGNLSVGFDSLGMAVKPLDGTMLGDVVTIAAADTMSLNVKGDYAARLPSAIEDNIVWHCLHNFHSRLQGIGRQPDTLQLTLEKNIPVSSGLGSSACSVVAALMALNEYYGQVFSDTELLAIMAEEEGKISGSIHYDNIAPCFLGGIQLMTPAANQPSLTLPQLNGVYWVMAYPDILISTRAAREVLPTEFSRQVTIEFAQNLAAFVAAATTGDTELALLHLKDVLVEPYRQDLLPGYVAHRQALADIGCQAMGISGSGPTVFATATDLATAEAAQDYLRNNYATKAAGFVHICQTDTDGARRL